MPVLGSLDAEPSTNRIKSAFSKGVYFKSGLGVQTCSSVATQSCSSPSFSVGSSVAGLNTLHLFIVMFGIFNKIALYLSHLAVDKWDVLCSNRNIETAYGTSRVTSEYPTISLEAKIAFSADATALRHFGKPAATGSSLLEK